jgi:putative protease
VYEVFRNGLSLTDPVASGRVELTFGSGAVDFTAVQPGQTVWKTDDQELTARLRRTFSGEPRRRQPVDLVVRAVVGRPVVLLARLASGTACELASDGPAVEALKHPLSEQTLREQMGRLGGTPFELRNLTAEIEGRPMLPLSLQLVRDGRSLPAASPET